ncbi:MAG: aminotransferase class I/II-fold pyridoxal phosphate-dependent enzyme [Acidobacteria bacterium]|nr:aminotransferase class I/II-fold pyridoxal phosphate-dependent enzyme [Acidobacteriota bacterium]NIM60526.1 aminotransferase class I/II-fold pyridoxal phosphate-dependent enzyme [Acidobacteriota bacterium]NIO59497.1 aminotransferase class I/II-fold pyridoxal phosphate-dependent enzyme [Acidobacteriota bacterium]NIQ30526.1 aminotransferase class I/II-fold pyridoxal phosphate-dependent enzyme [Acidobacteriota bacterium]NIQ85474.1 aminotransferase class I/II-fold pyridoxal phosphate-dependent e
MIADRVKQIGMSPTLRVAALAGELKRQGHDVLDLSAGQPDFPTPESVKQAGVQAIEDNQTRYTANSGMQELREAITQRIRRDHDLHYEASQILVSPGAKASLYFACMTLIDPGDEVIVPSPYWVTYPEQVRLAGGKPVFVPCRGEDGFRLDPDRLQAAITGKTRVLILNDPSNPTGASYSEEQLRPLAELCERHDLWIVADEIYSRLLYDGRRFVSVATLGEAIRERTVMINGMSKAWSMTGWRVGWTAAAQAVIDGMAKLQSHSTSNVTTISQFASVEALNNCDAEIARRVDAFQQRRNCIVERLRGIDGVRCTSPEGAFYVLPDCSERLVGLKGVRDGIELSEFLLERAGVAVVPGEAFGAADHLRLSYAVSVDRIDEGLDRIERALDQG